MHQYRHSIAILIAALAFVFLPKSVEPVEAQTQYCELALVLAMDASSSVDDREYQLQLKGMASALLDIEVQEAIESLGGIYLAAFEWNGQSNQKMLFNWRFVQSRQDLFEVTNLLVGHERNTKKSPTALGAALGFGYRLHQRAPAECTRHVIDVSGDGVSNDGIKPREIYALYDFSRITVNGLVIKDIYTNPESFYRDPEAYYRANVMRGAGAFLVLAHGFDDFEEAMKRKLLKEIVPGAVGKLKSVRPTIIR